MDIASGCFDIVQIKKWLSEYDEVFICASDIDKAVVDKLHNTLIDKQKLMVRLVSTNDIDILTNTTINEILILYYSYEFSDRFHVLTKSSNYPSIFNYVEQGLLTEDELIEALIS